MRAASLGESFACKAPAISLWMAKTSVKSRSYSFALVGAVIFERENGNRFLDLPRRQAREEKETRRDRDR